MNFKIFSNLKIILITLLIVQVSSFAQNALSKAKVLNTEGMSFYHQKDYASAAGKFKEAIAAYPGYPKAQYNLACVYSLLVECGEISGLGLSIDSVFSQLEKAIALDSQIRSRASVDKDFDNVRSYMQFYVVLGLNLKDSAAIRNILPSIQWFTGYCSPGAYGCSRYTLKKDGTFLFYDAIPPLDNETGNEQEQSKKNDSGKYYLKGKKVIFEYDNGKIIEYYFPDAKGTMKSIDGSNTLKDRDPDPCSA